MKSQNKILRSKDTKPSRYPTTRHAYLHGKKWGVSKRGAIQRVMDVKHANHWFSK